VIGFITISLLGPTALLPSVPPATGCFASMPLLRFYSLLSFSEIDCRLHLCCDLWTILQIISGMDLAELAPAAQRFSYRCLANLMID